MNVRLILVLSLLVLFLGCGANAPVSQTINEPSDTESDQVDRTDVTSDSLPILPSPPDFGVPEPAAAKTEDTETEDTETEVAHNSAPDQAKNEANNAKQDESDTDESQSPLRISDPMTDEEMKSPLDDMVTPDMIAEKAFAAPEGATSLSRRNVWVDRKLNRVYADGYVAMNRGPLEMFACPAGTKEHEAVVATLARAKELHAALLAIGAQVGTTGSYHPTFVPATGQRIRVWVCFFDEKGNYQAVDARDWIAKGDWDVKEEDRVTMQEDWVFAGSNVWTDPSDGHTYYQADGGDMICVSNFRTAMMDVPVASSAEADQLQYSPFTERIPDRGTPVRLVLEPIALPTDSDDGPPIELEPPTSVYLQKRH